MKPVLNDPEPQPPESRRLDRLLDRWITRGDSAALAALFDATSPRLLAVGIHLVGDPTRAEDLVQAVFLGLIEQRQTLQRGTRAEAWLTRVLRNKAVDLQRQHQAQAVGGSGLGVLETVAADASSADQIAERVELEGSIARAIDGLSSPYREVLIARLRHGMTAAEIAHLLRRSPGHVRVQLHRGLELLRAELPEREALAAMVLLGSAATGSPASLQVVRETIVAAAASAVPVSLPMSLALMVMFKTVVAAVVAAVLLLAAYTVMQGRNESIDGAATGLTPGQGAVLEVASSAALVDVPAGSSAGRSDAAAEVADAARLVGRVLDAQTEAPIPGARVRCVRRALHGAEWDEVALVGEFPQLIMQTLDGGLSARNSADWPTPEHVERRLLAHPSDPKNEILLEGVTDAEGRYSLEIPGSLWGRSLLEFDAPGYGVRLRPVPELETAEAQSEEGAQAPGQPEFPDVGLHRPYTLRAQLVDDGKQPLGAGISLLIRTQLVAVPHVVTERGFIDPSTIQALGVWLATTDEGGQVALDVFGERPWLQVVTPGWSGGLDVEDSAADSTVEVSAHRTTRLLFLDDASGDPIENVSVTLSNRGGHRAYLSGQFLAPGGAIGIGSDGGYLERECPMDLVAWTPRHAPVTLRIDHFGEPRDITLRLEAGAVPRLEGRVVQRGQAEAGLEVGLLPETLEYWNLERLRRAVVTTRTGADGAFRLSAPQGVYVLRVKTRTGAQACLQVQLPLEEPLEVDLASLGSIEVNGQQHDAPPTARCSAILDGTDGRRAQPTLDAEGHALVEMLPPGRYTVNVVDWDHGGGRAIGESKIADLLPGQALRLNFDLTPPEPGRCRLVCGDVTDFSSWRSRTGASPWSPVNADGVLEQEIRGPSTWIQVEDGQRRRFQFYAATEGGAEHVEDLARGTCGYRGTVRDDAGVPVPKIWVTASAAEFSEARVNVSALTGEDGSFELAGLEPGPYHLRFEDRFEQNQGWVKRWEGLSFEPDARPIPDATGPALNIQLRTPAAGIPVSGVVVDVNGDPTQAQVTARARYLNGRQEAGGVLTIGGKGRFTGSAPDGTFELLLPVGVPCLIKAYPDWSRPEHFAIEEITLDSSVTQPSLRLQVR